MTNVAPNHVNVLLLLFIPVFCVVGSLQTNLSLIHPDTDKHMPLVLYFYMQIIVIKWKACCMLQILPLSPSSSRGISVCLCIEAWPLTSMSSWALGENNRSMSLLSLVFSVVLVQVDVVQGSGTLNGSQTKYWETGELEAAPCGVCLYKYKLSMRISPPPQEYDELTEMQVKLEERLQELEANPPRCETRT